MASQSTEVSPPAVASTLRHGKGMKEGGGTREQEEEQQLGGVGAVAAMATTGGSKSTQRGVAAGVSSSSPPPPAQAQNHNHHHHQQHQQQHVMGGEASGGTIPPTTNSTTTSNSHQHHHHDAHHQQQQQHQQQEQQQEQEGGGGGGTSSSSSNNNSKGGGSGQRSSMSLYEQYVALYEKFKVLDDKYVALKKAMNEVLWEVLPKYTEDFNQLPPLDQKVDDREMMMMMMDEEGGGQDQQVCCILGGYEVREKIGEGRFAQVRVCRSTNAEVRGTEKAMCIKTLDKAMIKDARRGRRVHQEVFALRTLRHPNIIALYDVIHTRDHVHIITERLERDMFEYIHRHPHMSEGETFVLLWQIMAAIIHCHSRGIAHRDLKPENILVNYRHVKTPVIKVCDFGLSIESKEPLMEVEMVGSPGFLPPEILSPGQYDPLRGDVWSVGCILLEMVTDADYFKKVWMKPYEYISRATTFHEKMQASLGKLGQDLRLKLTDGLCDVLLDMLTLDYHLRPGLEEMRTRWPWLVANAKRYHMTIPLAPQASSSSPPQDDEVVLPAPELHRSPSEYSMHTSAVLVSSISHSGSSSSLFIGSPKSSSSITTTTIHSPPPSSAGGTADRLRTRVDAFTTKKTFKFKRPGDIDTNAGAAAGGDEGTSEGADNGGDGGCGEGDEVEEEEEGGGDKEDEEEEGGEEEEEVAAATAGGADGGGGGAGAAGAGGGNAVNAGGGGTAGGNKAAATKAKVLSPRTPKRQGVKPPSFFGKKVGKVSSMPSLMGASSSTTTGDATTSSSSSTAASAAAKGW